MKKLLSLLLIVSCFCTFFAGCANTNDTMDIANALDKNLNRLNTIVKKLDTIDTNYIANPDLTPAVKSTLPNNTQSENFVLAFNMYTNETNEVLKNMIIKNLQDKYLNNNGNCSYCNSTYSCDNDGYCNSCNNAIICDENGNCTNCNNPLTLNEDFSCSSCNKNVLVNKYSNQQDDYMVEQLSTEQLTTNTSGLQNNTNTPSNTENSTITETQTLEYVEEDSLINAPKTLEETENNIVDTRENNESNTKFYYYTRESFEPIKLKYRPRYVSEYNENNINDQLASYLFKVQRLYAMTEDAIEANKILNECKFNLIDCIREVKSLNNCIINGKCEPNSQQLHALKNYIIDIRNTVNNLKACNGDLTDEVNNISNNTPSSVATSVDVVNSNYLRLINHIDTRITYHESAIATLEQVKYLINDAMGNGSISEDELSGVIENLIKDNTITEDNIVEDNTKENNKETNLDTTPQEEVIIDENIIDTDIIEDETITEFPVANSPIEETETATDGNIEDNSDEILEDNDNVFMEDIDNNYEYNDNIAEDNNNIINEDENIDTENENVNFVQNDPDSLKNIDTYMDDTFPNNTIENENVINEENTEDKNFDNLDNENNNENLQNNTVNNSIVDNTPLDNNANNGVYEYNKMYPENLAPNSNNGTGIQNSVGYTNSIITQNNLNNDDGYGGYYYGNDGQIRNNGVNNNDGIGNNGNTIQNNLNNNNNVNTYGYNTMLDMINQGTVNNGINTLELKPNYVNSNIESQDIA